jgi:hypothetical protein
MRVDQFRSLAPNHAPFVSHTLRYLLVALTIVFGAEPAEAIIEDLAVPYFFALVPTQTGLFSSAQETPPTASSSRSVVSPALTLAGGNAWQPLGSWIGGYVDHRLNYETTAGFVSARLWLGLKNPAEAPAQVDILVEVEPGLGPKAVGILRCVKLTEAVTRVVLALDGEAYVGGGALPAVGFEVKVSARLGTRQDGQPCGATPALAGVRLYYDSTLTPSRVIRSVHREPFLQQTFALRSLPPPLQDPVGCIVDEHFGCLSPGQSGSSGTVSRVLTFGPLRAGGDWTTIGAWKEKGRSSIFSDDRLPSDVGRAAIVGLSDFRFLALAVKKPSDRGARLDILAEVTVVGRDGQVWASTGMIRCSPALSDTERTRVAVPFPSFPAPIPAGTALREVTLTLKARMGTTSIGAACTGPPMVKTVRLFWGRLAEPSEQAEFGFVAARAGIFLSARPTVTPNLAAAIPTAQSRLFVDSPPVSSAEGNPWRDIGAWRGLIDLHGLEALSDISPFRMWLGLKKTRDDGVRIDVRLVLRVSADSQTLSIKRTEHCLPLVQNPANANEVRFDIPELLEFYPHDFLQVDALRISVRIGTVSETNNALCGERHSATAVRLYFGSADRPSGVDFIVGQDLD